MAPVKMEVDASITSEKYEERATLVGVIPATDDKPQSCPKAESNDAVLEDMQKDGVVANGDTLRKSQQKKGTHHKSKNKSNKLKRKQSVWNSGKEDEEELDKIKRSFVKRPHSQISGHKSRCSQNGPFISLRGSRVNAAHEFIRNRDSGHNEREEGRQGGKQPRVADVHHILNWKHSVRAGVDAKPNKWDASETDDTWICVFCGKQHNVFGLGDLFGPYMLNASKDMPIVIPKNVNEICKDFTLQKDSYRYLKRTECVAAAGMKKGTSKKANIVLESENSEFWVHQDCLIWSDGVSWIPGEPIKGLREAVVAASKVVCSFCAEVGANVGCIARGCKKAYHYLCARDRGCQLDVEYFTIFCPDHQPRPICRKEPK